MDFYCKPLNLVIEVDGVSHDNETSFERDLIRQRKLEKIGLSFLRFDDLEVKRNIVSALRTVEGYIEEFEKIHPQPLRRSVNQK